MTVSREHAENEKVLCAFCQIYDYLAVEAQPLGDLVAASIDLLSVADIQWGVTHIAPSTRVGMMRSLGLPAPKKPTAMFAGQVCMRLQRSASAEQKKLATHLTYPVIENLLSLLSDDEINMRAFVDQLLVSIPQGLVRLAFASHWTRVRPLSPLMLKALLDDERLTLGSWAPFAELLVPICETAAREIDALEKLDLAAPLVDAPDDFDEEQSEPDAAEWVKRARKALGAAASVLPMVKDAIGDGAAPPPDALTALSEAASAMDIAGNVLGLGVPPAITLARLEEALATLVAEEAKVDGDTKLRTVLSRLAGAETNGTAAESLSILCAEALNLASPDDWSDEQRSRATLLADLVAVVDAAQRDDEEDLAMHSQRLTTSIDTKVIVAATRGRITLASSSGGDFLVSHAAELSEQESIVVAEGGANSEPVESTSTTDAGDDFTVDHSTVTAPEAPAKEIVPALDIENPVTVEVDETLEQTSGLEDLLAKCINERRFGISAWIVQSSGGNPGLVDALRVAALADALRSPHGANVPELDRRAASLSGRSLDGEHAGRVLALISALRVSLLHPQGSLSGVIPELAERVGTVPGLSAIVDAVIRATQRGLSLTADLLPAAQSVASTEERVALAASAASRELTQSRSTTFARGTKILSIWTGSDGLIVRLLDPVRSNDNSRRAHVEAEVLRLRDRREVEGEIDLIDRQLRGPGARRIEGQVRRALAGHLDRAVEVAAEWLDALAQLEAHSPDTERWQEVPLRELRSAVMPERERVLSSLSSLGEEVILAAIGRASAAMLGELLDLLDGHPLPGPERPPFLALHDELLKSSDVFVEPDGGEPTDVTLTTVVEAANRDWLEGFVARCERNQFDAAQSIVERVALDDLELATELGRECTSRLEEAVSHISELRRPLINAVNESRRSGFIDEDTWGSLSVILAEADPEGRNDLGRCDEEIDAVAQALAWVRSQAQITFDEEFAQKRLEVGAVEEQAAVITRLANAGDLATARDVMARAEAGDEPLTVTPTGKHVSAFSPRVLEGLAKGLNRDDVDLLEAEGEVADVSLVELSPGDREIAVRGLHAWVEMKAHSNLRPSLVSLAPTLRLIGIEADGEGTTHLAGGPDRRWIDLAGVRRTGRALVPAFGSTSGDRLRMLCCWGDPDASTMLALIAQDSSERPVVVLYFGSLSVAQRRTLAVELRSHSSRPVIVVDDAALLYLAAHGGRLFETLMQVTLPFASVNPYEPDIAGAVPTEMFYGRLAERRSVIEARGTSLIYGGRQLGKSALLHSAERRFEEVPGQIAIYVDLRMAAIGATKRPDAVWDPIVDGLMAKRAVEKRPVRKDPAAAVEEIIRAYLALDESRRVLLLLDECDDFFDADSETRFTNLSRLRELMDATDRRFKVVFAGLHQVQRFAAIPNQPLAHFGQPQVIGPLAPQPAFDLLHGPLEALGFDIGDDLAARLMANANYQPLALQIYGRALIDVLRRRPFSNELPAMVLPDDVEAVLSDEALSHQVRQRFELTLRLDPRYRVIAYAVAYRAQVEGHEHPITTENLRRECQEWWADGFAQLRPEEFRGLVEEMVGLGVLAGVPGGWRLRSPNVLRMLGTVGQIEDALIEAESETPPDGFAAAEARRVIDTSTWLRSPLSESQLADLLAPGSDRIHVVLGTQACGIDAVRQAIDAAATPRVKILVPRNKSSYKANLRAGNSGEHIVVLTMLEASNESIGASVDLALSTPPVDGVTRSVILVVNSANLDWWPLAFSVDSEHVAVVELRRHTARSMWAWAVDVPGAFQDERSRAELLEATGGWPYLVDRAGVWAAELAASGGAREEILARLRSHLASTEGATELVDFVGLRSGEEVARLYEMILALGGAPEARDDLAALADGSFEQPAAALEALCALGVIVVDRDGRLRPEPLFLDAWKRSLATSQ